MVMDTNETLSHRTDDHLYGQGYWDSLDNGAGYQDGVFWQDLAHIIKEVWGYDQEGNDRSFGVLDVGCAFGYLVKQLRARGVDTYGTDISEYALDQAPEIARPFVSYHDLTGTAELPTRIVESGRVRWDLVVCLETLEHIPEEYTQRALDHLRGVMAPDGYGFFAICLTDVEGWESDPTHINMHDYGWWLKQLTIAGFKVCGSLTGEVRRYRMYNRHPGVFVVTLATK